MSSLKTLRIRASGSDVLYCYITWFWTLYALSSGNVSCINRSAAWQIFYLFSLATCSRYSGLLMMKGFFSCYFKNLWIAPLLTRNAVAIEACGQKSLSDLRMIYARSCTVTSLKLLFFSLERFPSSKRLRSLRSAMLLPSGSRLRVDFGALLLLTPLQKAARSGSSLGFSLFLSY